MSEIRISRNYFHKGNPWSESMSPWTVSSAGPRWTTVNISEEARRRTARTAPRAWNLTAVEGKGRGDGSEPHRLQEGAAEGRTRLGNGGEQSAEEALGGVDVADSEASN
jgi:hypothetical protein